MEKGLKEGFVFDTSALISLGIIGLIDDVSRLAEITVTPSVIKELEEFAQFDDRNGKASKEVLRYKDKFIVKKVDAKESIEFIQETDNELYNVSKEKGLTLITDDIKFSRHVEGKIDTQFSTFFITTLTSSGNLSKKKALALLKRLRDTRNWRSNVIYLTSIKSLEQI